MWVAIALKDSKFNSRHAKAVRQGRKGLFQRLYVYTDAIEKGFSRRKHGLWTRCLHLSGGPSILRPAQFTTIDLKGVITLRVRVSV